jgi:hypothetical protein
MLPRSRYGRQVPEKTGLQRGGGALLRPKRMPTESGRRSASGRSATETDGLHQGLGGVNPGIFAGLRRLSPADASCPAREDREATNGSRRPGMNFVRGHAHYAQSEDRRAKAIPFRLVDPAGRRHETHRIAETTPREDLANEDWRGMTIKEESPLASLSSMKLG